VSGVADIRVGGLTRGVFLARSVLTAAGLYGAAAAGPALARALAHGPNGAFSGGDLGIVNFQLTLEKIEVAFYAEALKASDLAADARALFESISKNEAEHVKALGQTIEQLGGKADPAPKPEFPSLAGSDAILAFAIQLEDTGVYAYNGAASQIVSPDLVQGTASIAQVEARHAGALRELADRPPSVGPFDRVLSGEQADEAAHKLGA
jgi:rubrerythrin